MQRSQKGIACSLLYELFEHDMDIATAIVKELPHLAPKKRYSDWRMSDLLKALEIALKTSWWTTCIFIDGLNEIDYSEGPASTLGFMISFIGPAKIENMCF